jgi:hypothetical protein
MGPNALGQQIPLVGSIAKFDGLDKPLGAKPWSRPRRASKKAMTAARLSARRMP